MVCAVDREACTVKRTEKRIIGMRFMQPVGTIDLTVSLDVLAQRAAEGDVDDLKTAANAEDGGAPRSKCAREGELAQVAHLVNIRGVRYRLSVKARVDVTAAREQQGVGCFGRIRCRKTEQSERGEVVWKRL